MHNSVECTTELTFVISTSVIFYAKIKYNQLSKIDRACLENLKLIKLILNNYHVSWSKLPMYPQLMLPCLVCYFLKFVIGWPLKAVTVKKTIKFLSPKFWFKINKFHFSLNSCHFSRTLALVIKRLVCKWSGFQMGSEIWKPNHLKSGQMAASLSKTIWNLDFEWSGFWVVGTIVLRDHMFGRVT